MGRSPRRLLVINGSGWRRADPRDLRFLGGAAGSRTPDLFDANEARYQLRYSPECVTTIPGRGRRSSVVDGPAVLEDAVELADLGRLRLLWLPRLIRRRRWCRLLGDQLTRLTWFGGRRVGPALRRLRLHRVRRRRNGNRLPGSVGARRRRRD